MLIGLGMRESSGEYCTGRDMSASNTSAVSAEAGLFQMSWDAASCSVLIPRLLQLYQDKIDDTARIFKEGTSADISDLENYGSGVGATYQKLAKSSPAFAVEMAGVGLRNIGGKMGHWGPIRRKEVELRPEADALLLQVEQLIKPAILVGKGQRTAAKGAAPIAAQSTTLAPALTTPGVPSQAPTVTPPLLPTSPIEPADAMADAIAASERVTVKPASPAPASSVAAARPTEGSRIMKNDSSLWAVIRYIMIAVGGILVGKGMWGVTQADVPDIVDKVMPIGGAFITGIGALWGIYVTYNTRAVPISIAARPDIPTVSPVTGAIEPPHEFTPSGVPLLPLKG
jgi:hypothetical protein